MPVIRRPSNGPTSPRRQGNRRISACTGSPRRSGRRGAPACRRRSRPCCASGVSTSSTAERVSRQDFDALLLREGGPGSRVVDYYGLVEQVGVVFPLCDAGYRHVPAWGGVVVRDPYTLAPLRGESGMLQLMNVLARGAPYHSVLTEDLGRVVEGACACGRGGGRFELLGRVPKAETRGCANV
jgi:hypothetical protein